MDRNSIKTILFLDANESVIASILYAKSKGYRVITCDNISTHIGHKYADKAYNISTYDIESLEKIARKEKVDGVVYFCSAHGLYGATRIIEKFSLPGIPLHIEQQFSNKGYFRRMLQKLGLPNPNFQMVNEIESSEYEYKGTFPCIVKPVDSSGGNIGITKVLNHIQLKESIELAINSSFSKEAIIEDYIESDIQINGDCVVSGGRIIYLFIGKYLYFENSLVPFATIFGDTLISSSIREKIEEYLRKIILNVNIINGILNIELRVDKKGNIFFIEINPRHSGNRIFKLMDIAYNISLENLAVDLSLGQVLKVSKKVPKGYYAYCILYSKKEGVLDHVEVSEELSNHILFRYDFIHEGEEVSNFKLLKDRISLLLLDFNTREEQEHIMASIENFYSVYLKE